MRCARPTCASSTPILRRRCSTLMAPDAIRPAESLSGRDRQAAARRGPRRAQRRPRWSTATCWPTRARSKRCRRSPARPSRSTSCPDSRSAPAPRRYAGVPVGAVHTEVVDHRQRPRSTSTRWRTRRGCWCVTVDARDVAVGRRAAGRQRHEARHPDHGELRRHADRPADRSAARSANSTWPPSA